MKSVARLICTASIALVLPLSACGSSDEEPAADSTPTQTMSVVTQGFDSLEELSDYVAESLDGVEVHLESETNPDFDAQNEADRLHVDFTSDQQRAADMEATALIVQAASQAAFDYDILMVTGDVSAGEWSYLYDRDTVKKLTSDGSIVVADVWDAAEQSFDTLHR